MEKSGMVGERSERISCSNRVRSESERMRKPKAKEGSSEKNGMECTKRGEKERKPDGRDKSWLVTTG